jgi:4-amino-4-deoxychorismate lyase
VEVPEEMEYSYKYEDRSMIDTLSDQKGSMDDILMCREGWVMDTSNSNIAFRKNERWYTPSMPLLAGTSWKRLVAGKILLPRPVHQKDISLFDCYKLFNAMNDFNEVHEKPLTNIRQHG